MRLHRFTPEGVAQFSLFLSELKSNPRTAAPTQLLTDESVATLVPSSPELINLPFASRMDAARYLDSVLSQTSDCDVDRDVGLWTWLTLFFFDQMCPPSSQGQRKVGEIVRYIPAVDDYRKYYRHLLAGPYRVYRAHRADPSRALILLCGPLHKPGEIVEQVVARQEIITNPSAVDVATRMYFDLPRGTFKRGAAGKGKGSARRLADVLNQYDVTWDLYAMSAEALLGRLPKEFDRFRPASAT